MPAAAKEQTQEGLEAALEYWWETSDHLKLTGDAEPMRTVSLEKCLLCSDLMENWSAAYADGVWAENLPAQIDIRFSQLEDNSYGTYLFQVSESGGVIYEPDGSVLEDSRGDTIEDAPWIASARFDEADGNWKIEQIAAEE